MKILSVQDIIQRVQRRTAFGDVIDCTDVVVTERLDLSGLTIGNVDFSCARFEAPVIAHGTRFQGLAWFRRVTFCNEARFSRATFANDARFDQAQFSGPALFALADFTGIAMFDGARFDASATFDDLTALGNVSLSGAQVRGDFSLRRATLHGGLWLDDTTFARMPDFRETDVHGRLWVKRVSVAGQSNRATTGRLVDQLTPYGYAFLERETHPR
jgi:hypothetical protein